ncbi:MAG TPA: hypothetical protein VMK12_10215, partial [Anaeromyxobacteraceae bacterium]|nr:hypothetical protein [Anaeromyxobacteraceae bacterium]
EQAAVLGVTILGLGIGVERSWLDPWCDEVRAASNPSTVDGGHRRPDLRHVKSPVANSLRWPCTRSICRHLIRLHVGDRPLSASADSSAPAGGALDEDWSCRVAPGVDEPRGPPQIRTRRFPPSGSSARNGS